jgi:hypothetical protein
MMARSNNRSKHEETDTLPPLIFQPNLNKTQAVELWQLHDFLASSHITHIYNRIL